MGSAHQDWETPESEVRSGPHSILARLWWWSFFSCDAMAMLNFLQWCDIDYFWTFPTIAIVAIIFSNHRDRLFCNVCMIWGFWFFCCWDFGFILGLLEVLGGFLRDLGFFWGVLEVLRGFKGEHHHCCNYFFEPSGLINLRCFLR